MKALLALTFLLIVTAPQLDVCDECRKGELCKPHAELEETEIARLQPELDSDEISDRIDALRAVAALTYEHENIPSPDVARILAAALEDRSLRVRDRALRLLTDSQHPETTVVALVEVLDDCRKNMWDLVPWLTGRDQEHGTTANAMNYLGTIMRVSGDVPDDRVIKALAGVLLAMPTEMRGQSVAMAATRSLLQLGTRDAVRAVLRTCKPWSESREMRNIHDALRDFASAVDLEDHPEYGKDALKQWDRWFKRHARDLPAKLGKWRGKPIEHEDEDEDADEDDGGAHGPVASRPKRSSGRPRSLRHR